MIMEELPKIGKWEIRFENTERYNPNKKEEFELKLRSLIEEYGFDKIGQTYVQTGFEPVNPLNIIG